MSARKKARKASRRRFTDEFRKEAVDLADRIGVAQAASELGIQSTQIHGWRNRQRVAESRTEAENRLMAENARLKRLLDEQKEELTLLKKASAYFAKHRK